MPNQASAPQMALGERQASQLATRQRTAREDSSLLSEKGNIEEKNGEEKEFCFLIKYQVKAVIQWESENHYKYL